MTKKELFSRVVCGEVAVNGEKVRDPKRLIPSDSAVEFLSRDYVSRGGLKLERALDRWNILVEGRVFLDAGASTGGFTDCLLQHGAALVHSVDVGYNQLAYSLRIDKRVHVMEKTNIMHVEALDPAPQIAVADLSFRSLSGAAGHILSLTRERMLIALLKPQFEYRRYHGGGSGHGFAGIVDDPETTERIMHTVLEELQSEGIRILDVIASPIRGHHGNREFLLLLRNDEPSTDSTRTEKELEAARESGDIEACREGGDWRNALSQAIREAYE